jgi:hypothetical protein
MPAKLSDSFHCVFCGFREVLKTVPAKCVFKYLNKYNKLAHFKNEIKIRGQGVQCG